MIGDDKYDVVDDGNENDEDSDDDDIYAAAGDVNEYKLSLDHTRTV